jgi:hypothetical protein
MDNKWIWDQVKQPPPSALKQIEGGRLRGMTDISPQWRYEALTDVFGPCGFGWKYEIVRVWAEPTIENQVFAFAEVKLYVKEPVGDASWSAPIPGIGGSMLVESEKKGTQFHASDEGYKMAVTDALSVACKMLGIGADVYRGAWDGSKYRDIPNAVPQQGNNGTTGATGPGPEPDEKDAAEFVGKKAALAALVQLKGKRGMEELRQFLRVAFGKGGTRAGWLNSRVDLE